MARKFLNGVQSYFNDSNYTLLGYDSLDVVGGDLLLKRAGSEKLRIGANTATFTGDVTLGGTSSENRTLTLQTNSEKDSVINLKEGSANYGFSIGYYGVANDFIIKRHDNSASGTDVLTLFRENNNATFAGTVAATGLTTSGVTNNFTHGTAWGINLQLTNTNDDASPSTLTFLKDPASGYTTLADNDYIGFINFRAKNSNNDIFSWVELSSIIIDVTDGSEDSAFRIGTWGAGTEHANTIIAKSGNVGIGVATPASRLDVTGTDNGDTVRVANTGTYGGTISFNQGAGNTNIGYVGSLRAFEGNASGDNGIGLYSRDRISFYTNSTTPDLTIADNGNATFAGNVRVSTLSYGDPSDDSPLGALSYGSDFVTLETNGAFPIKLKTNGTAALTLDTSQNATFAGHLKLNAGKALRLYNTAGNGWAEIAFNESDNLIQVQRGIVASSDSALNLGTSSVRWANVYADTYYGDGSNLTGVTVSNADTVDSLHAASFLRSDQADSAQGAAEYVFNKPTPSGYQTTLRIGTASGGLYLTSDNAIIGKGAYYNNGWIATAANGCAIDFASNEPLIFSHSGATAGSAVTMSTSTKIWHAGNDGAGSGLDADTVDGIQGASLLRSDTTDTFTNLVGQSLEFDKLVYDWTAGSVVPIIELKGATSYGIFYHEGSPDAMKFSTSGNTTYELAFSSSGITHKNNTIWHAGNDGSGSGLDADTLDGQSGAYYRGGAGLGQGINYVASSTSTNNRGNNGAGVWAYSGYNTGTNRPYTYDATLQVMPTGAIGFELSTAWHSTGEGTLKIRSLRDCCEGWGSYYDIWSSANDGSGSGLDADTLDSLQASAFVQTTGNQTISGTKTFDSGSIVISGTHGTISFMDTTSGEDNFYLHTNSNNFYVLADRDGTDAIDGGYETPHPLQLEGDTNTAYTFGNRILTTADEGSGNGLDADTVDGIQASSFLRSDAADTASGNITFTGNISQTAGVFLSNGDQTGDANTVWQAAGTGKDRGIYPFRYQASASNIPATNDNANWGLNIYSHGGSGGGYPYGIQLAGANASSGENSLFLRTVSNGSFGSWKRVFHEGHLPTMAEAGVTTATVKALGFLRSDTDDTASGVITLSNTSTSATLNLSGHAGASNYNYFLKAANDGGNKVVHFVNGSTRTADGGANTYTIRNDGGSLRLGSANYTTLLVGSGDLTYNANEVWHAGNDGSGSGLDADTLDGLHLSNIDNAESYKTWAVSASAGQAVRWTIGRLYGTPAHWSSDWQNIEFQITAESYEATTLKYRLTGNYGGAGTQANMFQLHLLDAQGDLVNNINLTLGTPTDAGWDHSSQDVYYMDLYADVRYYSQFKIHAKTFAHGHATSNPTSGGYHTIFYASPATANISDFSVNHNDPLFRGNKKWHAGNDGSGSTLDADTLDGIQGASLLRSDADDSYAGNLTVNAMTFKSDSNVSRNFKIQPSSSTTDVGISAFLGSGTHSFQIYGTNNQYGFLDSNWGGWDIRKTKDGALHIDEGSGLNQVISLGSDGAGSGLDADTVDGIQGSAIITTSNIASQNVNSANKIDGIDFLNTGSNSGVNADTMAQNGHTYYTSGVTNFSGNATDGALYSQIYSSNWQHQIAGDYRSGQIAIRGKNSGTWQSWYKVWSANSDGSGSGLDADLLDGYHRTQVGRFQSASDFADGTLVTTSIVSSNTNGDSFVIEISGKAYGSSRPHKVIAEGYIYNDTIINTNGTNLGGTNFTYLKVMNLSGNLCIWWPRHGYWNSYDVYVRTANTSSGGANHNKVTAIANSTDPSSATKKIQINLHASWTAANDGSGSGLDADTVDGLNVHTGRNNEVNKIVRTDGNGYINAGWINTISGDLGTSIPDRIYSSNDGYIRYLDLASFRSVMNVTAKASYQGREQSTSDSNYWIGSLGWGTIDFNTIAHYGSGSIDTWSNPGNQPSGTSHWVGSQHLHYANGSNAWYGQQIVVGAGDPSLMYVRGAWGGTPTSWRKMWNAGNDGSGTGLDADLLDGYDTSQTGGASKVLVTGSNSYLNLNNWMHVDGAGIYSGVNGAHLYPNQQSDYGAWRIIGTRNGWSGITFMDGQNTLMANTVTMGFYNDTDNEWMVEAGRNGHVRIYYDGSQKLMTTSGGIEVTGSVTASGGGTFGSSVSVTGTVTASSDIVAYSDERLKSNIKTLDGSKVYEMHGVSFTKDDKKGSGVIAQELEKIAPELVNNDGEFKAVAYGNITGYLIEAIKDLKQEVEELKKQIK